MPSSFLSNCICGGQPTQLPTYLRSRMDNLTKLWRGSELQIELLNHYTSKVHESGTSVTGNLIISPHNNIPFAHVEINLLGESTVSWETVVCKSTSRSRFLRVDQPIPESAYPPSEGFLAGSTYKIPFNFVIPYELPSTTCIHPVDSAVVKDCHLRLPPTTGDWANDDMAPEFIRIQYSIMASVSCRHSSKQPYSLYQKLSKVIRVVSPSMEQPPLNTSPSSKVYNLTGAKEVYKGLFSGCLGRISVTGTQAQAVHLRPDMRGLDKSSVPITLTFAPTALDVIPPQINSVTAKIKSHTWYKHGYVTNFPDQENKEEPYTVAIPLEVNSPEKLKWSQHLDLEYDSNAKDAAPPIFHTTTSQVSFRLPIFDKTFLPTFHSCLASRTYSIHLCFNINSAVVELSVPIQIVIDGTRNQGLRQDSGADMEAVPAYS